MEVFEAIKTRRSIKQFTSEDVLDEHIQKMIQAAYYAPSAKNTQPWYFIGLRGEKKNIVADLAEKNFDPKKAIEMSPSVLTSCKIIRKAPVIILFFNKCPITKSEKDFIDNVKQTNNLVVSWSVEVESVAAAVQNILLTAHDMGYGAVWIADIYPARKQIAEFLNCQYSLLGAVAIGKPAYNPKPREIQPEIKWVE